MLKSILIVILIFGQTISYGQNNDLPNREAFTLNLAVDDTNFYQAEIQSSSYVLPDHSIQIYPGEKIFVEIELLKNEIKSMKTVKEILNPEKTIIISLTQEKEGKMPTGMMLKIENPFSKQLEYKANIFLMKPNKWVMTTVLPVEANLSSYETWPYIIVTMALSGWTFR